MISKELLSEVLGGSVYELKIIGNKIYPIYENGMPLMNDIPINIYELAHICKEWAFKKGYFVQSDFLEVNIYPIEYDGSKMKLVQCFDIVPIDCDSYTEEEIDSFPHNETEAIFKACEWIRGNR